MLKEKVNAENASCLFIENPECCCDPAGRRKIGKILASIAKNDKRIVLETMDPIIITELVIEYLKALNTPTEFELAILYKERKDESAQKLSVEDYITIGILEFIVVGEEQIADLDDVLSEKGKLLNKKEN